MQPPVLDGNLASSREGTHEVHGLGVLADVDESARPSKLGAEPTHVHVPLCIHFSQPKEGLVEATAVIEVELVGLVDDRLSIGNRTEALATGGYATDAPCVDGQGDHVEDVLFVGHRGHAG